MWDGWWFSAGVGAGAGVTAQASGCSGRKGLPRSEVSSGPLPADVTELCVSAVLPFFSAGAEKREGCLVLKHNRHCLAGILGGNTPKMTIPPEMTIIFNTAVFPQPRSYPLPPGLTIWRDSAALCCCAFTSCRVACRSAKPRVAPETVDTFSIRRSGGYADRPPESYYACTHSVRPHTVPHTALHTIPHTALHTMRTSRTLFCAPLTILIYTFLRRPLQFPRKSRTFT